MAEIYKDMLENTEEEDTLFGKYLTFVLGEEEFGLPIKYVTEIVGMYPVTDLPEMPSYVKGIINLRGRIIPVIDVRLRFMKPAVEYTDRTCVIVIDIDGLPIGLIVDNVAEVLTIMPEDIVPPPKLSGDYQSNFISGIGKTDDNVKLLLDCKKILDYDVVDGLINLN